MAVETVRTVKVTDSEETIFRFMQARKGDVIDEVMTQMGRSSEEQVIASTYALFRYAYMAYEALYEEFGAENGQPMYMGFWFIYGDWCIRLALKQMGLEKLEDIKDIPTLAELFHRTLNNFGEITKVSESSEERAVVDMVSCPSCMLAQGPFDRYMDRVKYYKELDSSDEIGYGKFCSEFPNMCGLGDQVEGKLTQIMCLAEGPTCRTVFEKKRKG